VAARGGWVRRVGSVAGALAGDQLFELAYVFALGDCEPFLLGFGDGDARELAEGRPVEDSVFEGSTEERQLLESLGDAELFLGGARLVAEAALDVFSEAAEAEV
jgi:hypothetical protein